MADSRPLLGYWAIRGLGQPIRFLAAYLDIDINEKRYASLEEWQEEKPNLELDFPNLPYLIDGDVRLTESRAIVRYVAREFGPALYPKTSEATITCDMVENVLWDIWFGLLRYCNSGLDTLKTYFDTEIPKKISYLNTFLEKKKFVLGDKISYVDFLLYEMLFHYTTYQADYLDKYPALVAFKKGFEEIPQISAYISSNQYIKGPCINPRAKLAF